MDSSLRLTPVLSLALLYSLLPGHRTERPRPPRLLAHQRQLDAHPPSTMTVTTVRPRQDAIFPVAKLGVASLPGQQFSIFSTPFSFFFDFATQH